RWSIPRPTYVLYKTTRRHPSLPDLIEIPYGADHQLPIEALAAANGAVTFVASPNSPSGHAVENADLRQLAARLNGLLVIDEALAVGDVFFVQKCMRFIKTFAEENVLLFVTHDTQSVVSLCSQAMVLDGGSVIFRGSPKAAVQHYTKMQYGGFQDIDLLTNTVATPGSRKPELVRSSAGGTGSRGEPR
ncbi:MAG: aminotransferase class I/II-fold pyridoxal phosphate-dependent enzyme, partial [Leptolyngbyaceae cyanobacterium RM2_2_4]|nr:aminotransferase class I/II-fold pyridoxal phosphate-dependent enzyme [Leptolyngbyaceae cyanobacterium RM2_2_4]